MYLRLKTNLEKYNKWFALHLIHILLEKNLKPHLDIHIPVYPKVQWMKLNQEMGETCLLGVCGLTQFIHLWSESIGRNNICL